jgi:hypothetical protein
LIPYIGVGRNNLNIKQTEQKRTEQRAIYNQVVTRVVEEEENIEKEKQKQ